MTTSYNDELKRLKKGGKPDSIYYLSANLPYLEKQIVETIATFAGDRNSIVTLDIMNTETTELEEILCINCWCCHEICPSKAVFIDKSWLAKRFIR